ncbi:aldo/keto reductase [Vibrio tritonius]|uniref:aldo/keto reductase n=1 Tax=Vibrio tritonius TaxID=1435069 RepID=UPI00315DCB34
MTQTQTLTKFSDGNSIPQIGLGVWQATQEQAAASVCHALKSGYRHIDTAAIYQNEEGVGQGIKQSGVVRNDIFVTTKVWNDAQGYEEATAALNASLDRLQLDYVDLLLIHWPTPKQDRFVDTWRAFIDAQKAGKVRSIGVSNFNADHLQCLIDETNVAPVINQIELHPYLQQAELRAFHHEHHIVTQAWSPLGQGEVLNDAVIGAIASVHGKTPAQIIIRWHMQLGNVAIPKSVTPSRIQSNFQVFDFELSNQEMAQIAQLDQGRRMGPDPLTFG